MKTKKLLILFLFSFLFINAIIAQTLEKRYAETSSLIYDNFDGETIIESLNEDYYIVMNNRHDPNIFPLVWNFSIMEIEKTTGNVNWSYQYDPPSVGFLEIRAMRIIKNNYNTGYMVVGSTGDLSASYHSFMMEISSNGTTVNNSISYNTNETIMDIANTKTGDYVLTGFNSDDPTLITTNRTGFCRKVNPMGGVIWEKAFTTSTPKNGYTERYDMPECIISFEEQNQEFYFITGSANDSAYNFQNTFGTFFDSSGNIL